jgi:jouberin
MGSSIWQSQQLLHPTFVYTSIFHPKATNPRVIATGSFDGMIRLWSLTKELPSQTNTPDKKFEAHKSNINSICYNADGSRLFSGDGSGLVKIWSCEGSDIDCLKTIDSLYGHSIQGLRLHPSNKKLMIQTLGPAIHLMDIRIFRILTHFELPQRRSEILKSNLSPTSGLKKLNSNNQTTNAGFLKPSFSTCGTFIFVGSVDGVVHFWRSESGVYLGSFNSVVLKSWIEGNPIVDISFHPHDHLIAFSVWGDKEPLRVYRWDEDSPSIRLNGGGSGKGSKDTLLGSTLGIKKPVKNKSTDSLPLRVRK